MGGGNPIKKVVDTAKKAVGQVSDEASRAGGNLSKVGGAIAGTVQDPGTWMAYLANPALGGAIGGQGAIDNYEALNEAEKAEARAEAERKMKLAEEQRLLDEQRQTEAEQAKMVQDRTDTANASAAERAKRLGTGRRGLLFQGQAGSETGTSKVLGG